MIKPILTEKSLKDAKAGRYSFWVPAALGKHDIKKLIGETFGVHVVGVRTQRRVGRIRITLARKRVTVKPRKKAIVSLRAKEKISLFEGDKK